MKPKIQLSVLLMFAVMLSWLACAPPTKLDTIEEIQSLIDQLPRGENVDYAHLPQHFSLTADASGDSLYINQRSFNTETGEEEVFYLLFTILSERLHPEGIFLESPEGRDDLVRLHMITAQNEIGIQIQYMGPDGPQMGMGVDRLAIGAWSRADHQASLEKLVDLLKAYALAHGDPERLATDPPSREPFNPWAEREQGLSFQDLPTEGEAYYRPLYRDLILPAYEALGTEFEASFTEADYRAPYSHLTSIDTDRLKGAWMNSDEGALVGIDFTGDLAQFYFLEDKMFLMDCRYIATETPDGAIIHFLYPNLETQQIESVSAKMDLLRDDQHLRLNWGERYPGLELRLQKEVDE